MLGGRKRGGTSANSSCQTSFFNPNHAHVQLFLLISDLCTINSYFFKVGCICFCLWLQTVGFVSQTRSFLLHSADYFQYSYPKVISTATEIKRVGLARLTCLSKKVTSWGDIGLEYHVWNRAEDAEAMKHSKKCHGKLVEKTKPA